MFTAKRSTFTFLFMLEQLLNLPNLFLFHQLTAYELSQSFIVWLLTLKYGLPLAVNLEMMGQGVEKNCSIMWCWRYLVLILSPALSFSSSRGDTELHGKCNAFNPGYSGSNLLLVMLGGHINWSSSHLSWFHLKQRRSGSKLLLDVGATHPLSYCKAELSHVGGNALVFTVVCSFATAQDQRS